MKSYVSALGCGGDEVAPEEVIDVPGSRDEEHVLEDVLEGAADSVPGVDGSDGPEGHGQEGGLEKFARGGVSDEDSGVLKMITKKRASSIGRCEVALQEDEAFMAMRSDDAFDASLEVRHSAHADGSEDVRGVIDEALGEVVDAPDLDVSLGVSLKDAEASRQKGRLGSSGCRRE